MKFNLAVTAILAIWSIEMVGRLATSVANEHEVKFLLLLLCLAVAVIVATWRVVNYRQEPAVFAAVTYLAFGAIVVTAEAIAGDLVRAVIAVVVSPILPVLVVGDQRTRRWVNRLAHYREEREAN